MRLNKNTQLDSVASIVLAGGQGTRLQPLTTMRCKPAVSFGGRFRLIDIPISNSLNSKISNIYVISQYLAHSLKDHIDDTYSSSKLNRGKLIILSPEEKTQGHDYFKGTADAVRKNWDELSKTPVEHFLILSGDQLYNIDFERMLEFARHTDADLVVASLVVEESEAKRMGLLKISERSQIMGFVEKPQDPSVLKEYELPKQNSFLSGRCQTGPLYLGSMGIYIFKKEALAKLLTADGDDFGKDIIPRKVQEGSTYAYVYDGYWEDIGTVEAFYHANLALTEKRKDHLDIYNMKNPIMSCASDLPDPLVKGTLIRNSIINPGAIIEAKEIFHSVIGISTHIHKGTVIKDTVVLGNHSSLSSTKPSASAALSIGEDCLIQKAIIDENACIGNRVTLTNENKLDRYDGDGVFIRDGIIVVTSGARIPDGFTL